MYQALYRKHRPRTFSDVTGQEHVTETLRRQVVSGRLSHAYLFVGTRGTGKTTCAKILSRAVNCLHPEDGNPCNKCASCVGIENGGILDVLELDAASNNGVDNVRALREEAIFTPAAVKKRVYIIDEVHMLSTAAFNALLKILEEPPEHLIFILATTELHKVPATILSRCQRFSFKRISPSGIAARLSAVAEFEGLSLSPDAAQKLAALADGSMRDALSLLDQCASDTTIDLPRVLDTTGLSGHGELLRIAGAVSDRDSVTALGILDGLFGDGRDMPSLLNEFASLLRDLLVYKLSPDSPLLGGGFSGGELSALSEKFPPERLFFCLDAIKETISGLTRGGGVKLPVEMCLIKMCDERPYDGVPALIARIARLEDQLRGGAAVPPDIPPTEPAAKKPAPIVRPAPEPKPPVTEPDAPVTEPDAPVTEQSPPSPLNNGRPDAAAVGGDGDFWSGILNLLKADISTYALLSDSASISAELQGATLIIRAKNAFAVHTIESKKVSDAIKDAARQVLGREVTVRAEAGTENRDESRKSKLDSLSAFDIIKFE